MTTLGAADRPARRPMTEDEARDEIARLRAEISERTNRVAELRKLLSYPTVTPVQVCWRHGTQYRDDWEYTDEPNAMERAYRDLAYAEDHGYLSPIGVEVGGVLVKVDELQARFGDIVDWARAGG